MGMTASAHLAYGYDLGSEDDFKAAERGEYGSPKLPWYNPEAEDDDDEADDDEGDFGTLVEKLLLRSVGFTDEWAAGGSLSDGQRKIGQVRGGSAVVGALRGGVAEQPHQGGN